MWMYLIFAGFPILVVLLCFQVCSKFTRPQSRSTRTDKRAGMDGCNADKDNANSSSSTAPHFTTTDNCTVHNDDSYLNAETGGGGGSDSGRAG